MSSDLNGNGNFNTELKRFEELLTCSFITHLHFNDNGDGYASNVQNMTFLQPYSLVSNSAHALNVAAQS